MAQRWGSWYWYLGVASWLAMGGAIIASEDYAIAQIGPDTTQGVESSVVTPTNINGLPSDRIDGGAYRGANLFHSFQEFNIGEGQGAYFANPAGIENILSRVTGSNPSNIFGKLGVLGNANLFLINPNGIIFGPNASLDIGGSFIGTTANAIRFGAQGFFSATDPEAPPLLTVNPSAFLLTQLAAASPRTIKNQGYLQVPDGQSLLLVGGDVRLNRGIVAAFGGRVELGGLADAGSIGLDSGNQGLKLQFPEAGTRADVSLNRSIIDVSAGNGGDVAIYARNLELLAGSRIFAGIDRGLGSAQSQAGDITLNATDTIRVESGSFIENDVNPNETGNAGNLNITTGSLFVLEDAYLSASTFGNGDAGSVTINARDCVSLNRNAIILSRVGQGAVGQGGDVRISTGSLELIGSQLSSGSFGQGNAGDVVVDARDSVVIQSSLLENGRTLSGGIFSTVEKDAVGQGGDIRISTGTLELSKLTQLSASTYSNGDAGDVHVQAQALTIDGGDFFSPSGIYSGVGSGGFGRGGDIEIETGALQLLNGAELFAGVTGVGIGGNIRIRAQAITLAGKDPNNTFVEEGSKITSRLGFSGSIENGDGTSILFGIGKAGNVEIQTGSLTLGDNAFIDVSSAGEGNAGNVRIRAETIVLNDASSIFSSSTEFGNAGDIEIQTGTLRLSDGSQLGAFTEGLGTAGNIRVTATDAVELIGSNPIAGTPSALFTDNDTDSPGVGGNITVNTSRFRVADGAIVDARTRNQNAGGDITINTDVFEALNGGQLITTSQGSGRAGTITVDATQQLWIDGSDPNFDARRAQFGRNRIGTVDRASGLFVRSQADGIAGDILVNAPTIQLNNGGKLNAESFSGAGGNIGVQSSGLLLLRRGSTISTTAGLAEVAGNGGNITINAPFIVSVPSENSDITAKAFTGSGGNIQITASGIFGTQFRDELTPESDITASSEFGVDGEVEINTPDVDPSQGLAILPAELVEASGLINQGCTAGRRQGESKFIVTGRGELPIRPTDAHISYYPTGSVRSIPSSSPSSETPRSFVSGSDPSTSPTNSEPAPIVEAQGWMINDKGEVVLTAQATTVTPNIPWMNPATCHTE